MIICTVAVKNIRNMHTVSTNKITDILHFNNNLSYCTHQHVKEGIYNLEKTSKYCWHGLEKLGLDQNQTKNIF